MNIISRKNLFIRYRLFSGDIGTRVVGEAVRIKSAGCAKSNAGMENRVGKIWSYGGLYESSFRSWRNLLDWGHFFGKLPHLLMM